MPYLTLSTAAAGQTVKQIEIGSVSVNYCCLIVYVVVFTFVPALHFPMIQHLYYSVPLRLQDIPT